MLIYPESPEDSNQTVENAYTQPEQQQQQQQQPEAKPIPVTGTVVKPVYPDGYRDLTIAQLKTMRRNTSILSFALVTLGMVSSYAALSGTKYPLQNFCYMPDAVEASDKNVSDFQDMESFKLEAISRRSEKLNNRARRRTRNRQQSRKYREIQTKKVNLDEFCRNGANIYTTHPSFLLTSDQPVAKSEFNVGSDKYRLPARNRLDLDLRVPSNPDYIWYGVFGVMLSSTGVMLYSASSKKYLELFPKMFEQYKTFTLESQLIETEKREEIQLDTLENMTLNRQTIQQNIQIQTHATAEKTAYVQEQITKQYQGYRALDYSEAEIEVIQLQAQKQQELEDLAFDLQRIQIAKEIATARLETAKDNKEISKIEGKDTKQLSGSNDVKQQRIDRIKEVLKAHEDGWLIKLIEFRKPLWILGGQGAGKSTLASCLILLRYFTLDCPLEMIIDAHAQVNRLEAWTPLVEVFGKDLEIVGDGNDYLAIADAFSRSVKRWSDKMPKFKNKEIGKSQMLVDEFSNLSDKQECQNEAGDFSKHSLSDPRKAGEYVLCLAHYGTLTATGNKGGTAKARNTQTIQVERKSANGETPLPNVTVNGLPDENGAMVEFEATIPGWFRPEKILSYFQDGVDIFGSVD